jgi:hypothetical protein
MDIIIEKCFWRLEAIGLIIICLSKKLISPTYVTALYTGLGFIVVFENNRGSEIREPGAWHTTFLEKYNFSCTILKNFFHPKIQPFMY